jgi:iron(III) transport system substrate-binding protein
VNDGIPAVFRGAGGTWTGFAARARVLLLNKNVVKDREMPGSVLDLADPARRGQSAVANPLFGTTTMHIAALFSSLGDEAARRFMRALKENEVRIAGSNGEVKRLVVAGEVAFGLTDTDDAAEALKSRAPVEVVYPDQNGMGTLVMPTSATLIRGGPNPKAAERILDCLIGAEVERRMAESAAHMPLRNGVKIPATVRSVATIKAMAVDYAEVAKTMERIQPFLREWAGL